jgi:hypothetical protein
MELKGTKFQHKLDWMVWHQSRNRINNKEAGINQIKINFLDDQRHWIFIPAKITVYGSNEKNGF